MWRAPASMQLDRGTIRLSSSEAMHTKRAARSGGSAPDEFAQVGVPGRIWRALWPEPKAPKIVPLCGVAIVITRSIASSPPWSP